MINRWTHQFGKRLANLANGPPVFGVFSKLSLQRGNLFRAQTETFG